MKCLSEFGLRHKASIVGKGINRRGRIYTLYVTAAMKVKVDIRKGSNIVKKGDGINGIG